MNACVPARCLTVLLPPGVALSPGALAQVLRYAQRRQSAAPWNGAVAEAFRTARGTLLLLRPALSASLAPYALPFIHKYFKD